MRLSCGAGSPVANWQPHQLRSWKLQKTLQPLVGPDVVLLRSFS